MQFKKFLWMLFAALLLPGAVFDVTAQRKAKKNSGATEQAVVAPSKETGKQNVATSGENVEEVSAPPAAQKRNSRPATFSATIVDESPEPTANVSVTANYDSAFAPQNGGKTPDNETAKFVYEFKQPEFFISHIVIEHNERGRGSITFERKTLGEPIVESFALSPAALTRVNELWQSLDFLNAAEDYQAPRQYPHLGTVSLRMSRGERERTAEFNWTANKIVNDLVREYRRIMDQALFVFDINLARTLQPLEAPKLMERLEKLVKSDGLSDTQQIVPLLRELAVDERLPLMSRNRADKILKIIEKPK